MCSSKSKLLQGSSSIVDVSCPAPAVSHINGRPVLQPATCNRVPLLERHISLKKGSPKPPAPPLQPLPSSNPTATNNAKIKSPSLAAILVSPPISPKLKSPRPPAVSVKRGNINDPNGLSSSAEKLLTPRNAAAKSMTPRVKKSKKCGGVAPPNPMDISSLTFPSSLIVEAPGTIAAARREQVAIMQVQRKMKTAHYGRTKSGKVVPLDQSSASVATVREEKRCSFITNNSAFSQHFLYVDPIYVAYHDREWGVPVHDDNHLFELLVLTGAQVGSDWTSVLKKRQGFRDAFLGFDAESVSKYSEKKISSIGAEYGIELSQIRGVVDNANQILEIKKKFGSFHKYLWGFVNHKPIATLYKSCHKIPVKTSKSEAMSKDMVRRGFRLVGPTVMHSFMEAAGLTNNHLITCPRHLQCAAALESQLSTSAPPPPLQESHDKII